MSADPRENGCKCDGCERRFKVDIFVPDDLWEKFTGRTDGGGILCGHCLVDRLERLGFGAFSLEPVR